MGEKSMPSHTLLFCAVFSLHIRSHITFSSIFPELNGLLQRQVEQLSGGELQRFAIAMCCVQKADVYMFDEPSSYLDVKQRLRAAALIRDMIAATT